MKNDCSKKADGASEELSRVMQMRHSPVLVLDDTRANGLHSRDVLMTAWKCSLCVGLLDMTKKCLH